MTTMLISYDGSPNDGDALALGHALAQAGLTPALAYVRHAREFDARREEVAQHDAVSRLERGAEILGDPQTPRHVVVSASTGAGLARLATAEEARLIVFGSDYRTAPGRVEPGVTAQHLLDGGSVAVAIAAAGLRTRGSKALSRIAVPLAGPQNEVARATAASLAAALEAEVVDPGSGSVDLIVVGSAPGASGGRIALGGDVRTELGSARSSVLVLPAGPQTIP